MRRIIVCATAVALAACTQSGGGKGSADPAEKGQLSQLGAPPGSPCDRKLITTADVAPLLTEPIATVKAVEGDAQSCTFITTGFSSLTATVRPGHGKLTVDSWKAGTMNLPVSPLPGVGDDAVWQDALKEVIATKDNVLCDIHAIGPASTPATRDKVAALCLKIFAAG